MENKEILVDRLMDVENKMDKVVDNMIYMYGKFVSLDDVNAGSPYKRQLVTQYYSLLRQKNTLNDKIDKMEM